MTLAAPKFVRTMVLDATDGYDEVTATKVMVAKTECRIPCPTDEILETAIQALRESDEHLRNRPEELKLWNWLDTWVEKPANSAQPGGTVILSVGWFNIDFFEKKKDVYTNPAHLAKYLQIGVLPGSMTVKHWRLDGEGKA